MSQHIADSIYQENVPVVVCIGWDRTLQYFFLAVETKDLGDDSEDGIPSTVYNTLDEVDCFRSKHSIVSKPSWLSWILKYLTRCSLNQRMTRRMVLVIVYVITRIKVSLRMVAGKHD